MAQEQHHATPNYGFRSIKLLKTQTLGIGSYGSVCKALCDDSLLCAAKIIHQTLVDPNAQQQIERHREQRLPIIRFKHECEFMSAIRHPNIVLYLGTHQDPQTDLPVLLMELMDDSLTHFLESSQDAVPYHIQVNFGHDITLAISYLHSNEIIHRDLSSNNVLLRENLKAKITDFGMAKLGDINPQATHISTTMCPGTDAYMPPEAVNENPVYTAKIDCFAIGVLIVQTLTRCFPKPGVRHKTIKIDHPRFPGGTVDVRVSEVERRQNHISQVDPNHPLLPIALDCLKDSDIDRPSAQELCHRVAALKETSQFTKSAKKAQERVTILANTTETKSTELQQQIQEKDAENHQLRQEHSQEIQGLQQIIRLQIKQLKEKDVIIQNENDVKNHIIREKEETIAASQQECQQLRETTRHKDKLIECLTQELESSQQVMGQFQERIQELEQQVKEKPPTEPSIRKARTLTRTGTREDIVALNWEEDKKAPCLMARGPNAIVDGEIVYLRAGGSRHIYAYKLIEETWNKLPECRITAYTLVVIKNLLTTVGGESNGGKVSNQLFSLTREGWRKRWKEVFQSMPTKRSASVAVSTERALIVAGGVGQDGKTLTTVEIMDIDNQEWSSAVDLSVPFSHALLTICQDHIYLVGGSKDSGKPTKSTYKCNLTDLFLSCRPRSLGERLIQTLSLSGAVKSQSIAKWDRVADLPVVESTCVTLNGRLIAIGGRDSKYTPSSDVRIYHPTSDSWELISKMKVSRWNCFVAVLPDRKLMVLGGHVDSMFTETYSIEIANIV